MEPLKDLPMTRTRCGFERRSGTRTRAGGGHLQLLKWAMANRLEPHADAVAMVAVVHAAASEGDVDTIKWLHEQGFKGDRWAMYAAARANRLETVRWMYANGIPWDAHHLELLRWVRHAGCP